VFLVWTWRGSHPLNCLSKTVCYFIHHRPRPTKTF